MAAQPNAELPATVAWQLSRASGKMLWTDTHKSTCIHTFKHFHIQVHKQLHARAHEHKEQSHCTHTQMSAWPSMLARASTSRRSLCKGNMKSQNVVYLPPLKMSQTSFTLLLSFSFSKFSFWFPPICWVGLPTDFSAESSSLWGWTHAYSTLALGSGQGAVRRVINL